MPHPWRFEGLMAWLEAQPISTSDWEGAGAIPWAVMEGLFDRGFFSLLIPEAWGGLGASMGEFCRIVARTAEVDASLTVTLVPHSGMGCKSFLLFGTEDQKRTVLARVGPDRGLIAYAQTEPQAGSDFSGIRTTVRRAPDGTLRLNGSKIWITNGGWAKTIVVVAKCPDHSANPEGLVFVYLTGQEPGVRILQPYQKMAFQASVTSELYFDDVVIEEDRVIGVPGKGLAQFNSLVSSGRMGVASGALGLLRRAARLAQRPDGRRATFPMEALVGWAAPVVEKGGPEATLAASLTKIYCTERAWGLTQDWMRDAGPQAYLRNDGLSQVFREMPHFRITEGPNEVIGYRCGLDLLLSPFRALEATNEEVCGLPPDLADLRATWDEAWPVYQEFLRSAEREGRPLASKQLLLDRVVRSTLALSVLAGLIRVAGEPREFLESTLGECRLDFWFWCRPVFDEDARVEEGL